MKEVASSKNVGLITPTNFDTICRHLRVSRRSARFRWNRRCDRGGIYELSGFKLSPARAGTWDPAKVHLWVPGKFSCPLPLGRRSTHKELPHLLWPIWHSGAGGPPHKKCFRAHRDLHLFCVVQVEATPAQNPRGPRSRIGSER